MKPPLLEVRDLRIEAALRPDPAPLLHQLTFSVAPGERVAIVGESGSGKTLATRAIPALLPEGVIRTSGSIRFAGRELTRCSDSELRSVRGADIGLVFQEPMTSLNPALPIGVQLAEGLRLHRHLGDSDIRSRSIDMLRRVRIADPEGCLAHFPHEFSGGMRQRIMLASVLLLEPRLLIADEPTTALDTLSQREVLRLMVGLTRELGTALLLITHDLGLVAEYTERVLVLERGILVEEGRTADVLARPRHAYTARLIGSLPRRDADRPSVAGNAGTLLRIEEASVDYAGKPTLLGRSKPRRVVDRATIDVKAGEIVALVGASGSGKTTIGRAALGLLPLASGAIRFEGRDVARLDGAGRHAFRRDAQLVFQDPFSSLPPHMRISEIVGAALRHSPGTSRADRERRILETLEDVGLSGFEDRRPHQMSGGQRQRIAIARAIASRPRLIVADEPVSALDVTIQRQVLDLLQRLQRERGFACLFITHDLAVVDQIADRIVVMEHGRIVEEGPAESVLAAPAHPYTRALIDASPALALALGGIAA